MPRVDLGDVFDFPTISDTELAAGLLDPIGLPEINLTEEDTVNLDIPLLELSEDEWITELDDAFQDIFIPTTVITRGVGYCENDKCSDYGKGSFLFMHEGNTFTCVTCNKTSDHVLSERGIPEREGNIPFATVRIEYAYAPARREYTEIAVLTDEGYNGPSGTYTVQNPLCKTSERAFKIAETHLSIINQTGAFSDDDLSEVPKCHEILLSFDKPIVELRKDLERLERRLSSTPFLQKELVVSDFIEVESDPK